VMAQERTQMVSRQANLAPITTIKQNPVGSSLIDSQEAFRRQRDIQHQAGHGGTSRMIHRIVPQAGCPVALSMRDSNLARDSASAERLCHTVAVVSGALTRS